MLCEIMAENPDGCLQITRLGGYALSMGMEHLQLAAFIKDLKALELLQEHEAGKLTNQRMQEHKAAREKMSQGARNSRYAAKKEQPAAPTPATPTEVDLEYRILDMDKTPLEILQAGASISMDQFRLQFDQELKKRGSSFDQALEKWNTSLIAKNQEIDPDPGKQVKQLVATLRRYILSWLQNEEPKQQPAKRSKEDLKA
jgi:hypothetical protein